MKEKIISIDILKFFAALLITNSHLEILYHPYEVFATGGAIGDVLFFFASGYTLFLGRMGRFDNWYKRRINRIYPTVFAWAILASIFFDKKDNIVQILLNGGGWFVSCIMIYYLILYFIRRYMANQLKFAFFISTVIIIFWYLLLDRPSGYNMYGDTYFKWGHYFLFMLLGASIGIYQERFDFKFKTDLLLLIVFVFIYYLYLFIGRKYMIFEQLQILSILPLLGITFYFYKWSNSSFLNYIYNTKYVGNIIKLISGLCFEIYLVQYVLITDKMNSIFPVNIFIMFIIIITAAYFLKCLARFISQTFKDTDYNWSEIIRVIE